ncbi:MAG: hypothetical protein Tsb0020_18980 [Haliangiales bacterium]
MAIDFSEWQATWIRAVAKSWEDEQFRKALLNDPRAAVKAFFGEDFPGAFPLKAYEAPGPGHIKELAVTFPARPKNPNEEAEVLAEYANDLLTNADFFCTC